MRLAGKLVGWNLDIKSEVEKKAEVEAEMERMATASQELASLPNIDPAVSTLLLDAGFRAVEELTMASMEDLTAIEGIDEETAIAIHDSAEVLLEQWAAEAAARAEAGEDEEDEQIEASEEETINLGTEAETETEPEGETVVEIAAADADVEQAETAETAATTEPAGEPVSEQPDKEA